MGWVGLKIKSSCPHVGPDPALGVVLFVEKNRGESFEEKSRKSENGYADKWDCGLDPAPPIYQFWEYDLSAYGGLTVI